MVFQYKINYPVADTSDVIFKVVFPDPGTAGYHLIDIAGPVDKEDYNECSLNLGKGVDLKKERSVVFSKLTNMKSDCEIVRANYYLNDVLIQKHSNPKATDRSPMIKLTINFS